MTSVGGPPEGERPADPWAAPVEPPPGPADSPSWPAEPPPWPADPPPWPVDPRSGPVVPPSGPGDPWAAPAGPVAGWDPQLAAQAARRPMPVPDPLTEFPQLMRPRARWWKPVLGLLLGFVLLVVIGVPVITVVAVVVYVRDGSFDQSALEPDTALGLLANNLLLAALIPVSLLVVLVVHRLRPRFLCSVEGWLRWRLLPPLLLAALVVTGVFVAAQVFVEPPSTSDAGSARHVAALIAVVLLTTPLQAAGEEFFFRGYLLQAVGSWFARPRTSAVVGGLVSSTLFALAHGTQGPALFADRFAFGAVAAWLVWRTGGLEAGIALHVLNNLVSLGIAVVTGSIADALAPGDISVGSALVDVAMMAVYALVVTRLLTARAARRVGEPPADRRVGGPPAGAAAQ